MIAPLVIGFAIILVCNAVGWIAADLTGRPELDDMFTRLAYAGAIGVLLSVIY